MNGPWALLLKLFLSFQPFVLGWFIWMTVEQVKDAAFREAGPRVTPTDLSLLKSELMTQLPPRDWRERIVAMEAELKRVSVRQERILALLENRLHDEG